MKDTLFQSAASRKAGSFEFDQRVASVFDDMVGRSVPGYQTIQLLTADLALCSLRSGCILDIGCSTGATIHALTARAEKPLTIVGIDSSPAMLEQCAVNLPKDSIHSVLLRQEDVTCGLAPLPLPVDVVILNLTLQFIRPLERTQTIKALHDLLVPGGALIMVEKTVEADTVLNGIFVDYYHAFKREMGYSELEIAAKREALENVLVPFRRDENLALLRDAGFARVTTFFQWFNFCGFYAVRG